MYAVGGRVSRAADASHTARTLQFPSNFTDCNLRSIQLTYSPFAIRRLPVVGRVGRPPSRVARRGAPPSVRPSLGASIIIAGIRGCSFHSTIAVFIFVPSIRGANFAGEKSAISGVIFGHLHFDVASATENRSNDARATALSLENSPLWKMPAARRWRMFNSRQIVPRATDNASLPADTFVSPIYSAKARSGKRDATSSVNENSVRAAFVLDNQVLYHRLEDIVTVMACWL